MAAACLCPPPEGGVHGLAIEALGVEVGVPFPHGGVVFIAGVGHHLEEFLEAACAAHIFWRRRAAAVQTPGQPLLQWIHEHYPLQ